MKLEIFSKFPMEINGKEYWNQKTTKQRELKKPESEAGANEIKTTETLYMGVGQSINDIYSSARTTATSPSESSPSSDRSSGTRRSSPCTPTWCRRWPRRG